MTALQLCSDYVESTLQMMYLSTLTCALISTRETAQGCANGNNIKVFYQQKKLSHFLDR